MTMTKIHLELEQLLHLEHEPAHPIHDLSSFVQGVQVLMPLINGLPNITFFIKDLQARYVLANVNLAVRSGLNCVDDLLGKTNDSQGDWVANSPYPIIDLQTNTIQLMRT